MALPASVSRVVRPYRCPVYEARNRALGALATRRNRKVQQQEIAWFRGSIPCMTPRASVLVVIPTYRRPEGLARALGSVLQQTFEDFVVVVVDDGGGLPDDRLTDDPRVTTHSLSENHAVLGLVRNVGIHAFDSEFIAFLDDDNEWTPEHLAVTTAALQADTSLGGVYTSVSRRKPDGSEVDVLSDSFDRARLRWDPYIDANSIVVRRSANRDFSVLPRTKDTLPKEDWEYVWRLTRFADIRHVPEVTVHYTVNPASYYTDWG